MTEQKLDRRIGNAAVRGLSQRRPASVGIGYNGGGFARRSGCRILGACFGGADGGADGDHRKRHFPGAGTVGNPVGGYTMVTLRAGWRLPPALTRGCVVILTVIPAFAGIRRRKLLLL